MILTVVAIILNLVRQHLRVFHKDGLFCNVCVDLNVFFPFFFYAALM